MGKDPDKKSLWEMQRERHQILRRRPPAPERATDIGSVIPTVMKSFGMEKDFWEQEMIGEWAEIVGPQIAQHTRPGRLDHATLYVYVSHAGWLNELARYGQKEILSRLQARFGTKRIRAIRLHLDPDKK